MAEWCKVCGHEASAHVEGLCADCHAIEIVEHGYNPEPRPPKKTEGENTALFAQLLCEGMTRQIDAARATSAKRGTDG